MKYLIIVFASSLLLLTFVGYSQNTSPPINDDPVNAINLTTNNTSSCAVSYNGTNIGAVATPILQAPAVSNPFIANNDVWFTFVASSTSHLISLSETNPSATLMLCLYTHSLIGGLFEFPQPVTANRIEVTNLNPNSTYYIRVFTQAIHIRTNFRICITTPTITSLNANLPIVEETTTMKEFRKLRRNIISVAVEENYYKVKYFDGDTFKKARFPVEAGFVYTNRTTIKLPVISILNVPFKVRPKLKDLKPNVNTSIKNIGVMAGPYIKWDRYPANGKQSTHKVSAGIMLAPSGEEFNKANTRNKIDPASTQLVLSTGLIAAYSYNNITFAVIPYGRDYGLTKDAKHWRYNKKFWWGLGIGVDTKLFGL